MEEKDLTEVVVLENSVEEILESLGDDFSWSGFTVCDCGTGIRHFTLLPNGDVAICPVLSTEKTCILGNVTGDFNWDKIVGLLNFSSDEVEPCSKCWIRKFCGGGCFASNYKVNGNLLKPYKQLCNVSKHVVLQSIVLFSKICENHYKEFFLEL